VIWKIRSSVTCGGIASLGVHPSSSVEHKFQESRNVNGSDSVTQNYRKLSAGHRSVMDVTQE